ncbi:enoyl-CoA hydratase/isomerase family protein [Actinomadura parmotrematis]|uniref:Enoyl-CoA hydratase/isomerase family protein n=1 Tax=Actinomadura parmotrematis TaxID=2864039 RepID=A0ABS7G3S2_9ACTN|nr:enoyl-CoA hydratase-related protein [Actinomadura parmotrematis]MBW8487368.1 enoyl-CoA hydratase/isomerase family protein [Actinomadura parmotrematis]
MPLGITDEGAVRLLTFRRPERANAFDDALYRDLAAALDAAAGDGSVSAVVLTGEGRTFSAGTDLEEMAAIARAHAAGEEVGEAGKGFGVLMDALIAFPKPLLAAVNGSGVGLGLTLLAHCDLVLVADGARFQAPFTTMGVAPEAASSYLLPLLMGAQRAALVLLAGRWIPAAELVASGLALSAHPADEVLAATLELAREIAGKPLASLVATKRLIAAGRREAVLRAREREDAAFDELLARGLGPA